MCGGVQRGTVEGPVLPKGLHAKARGKARRLCFPQGMPCACQLHAPLAAARPPLRPP